VRTLLVEDHPDMRLALQRLLEQDGASVDAAVDGYDAVEKAAATAFDLVLMDLHMPRMNGYQAARALRDADFRAPIVAITADSAAVHRADVVAVGCDTCLSKPFTVAELVESIPSLRQRWRG
jgi:CheY-like chemotaxis protein